jgi:hypothetical protein
VRSLRLDASGGFQFSDALGQIFVGGQQFAEPDERTSFEVTICDLKDSASSVVNWNMKSSGKRSGLRRTAWLSAFVGT